MPDQLDAKFALKSYRPGQKEAIKSVLRAFANGKKYVLLEGPTGTGKSAIAHTVAQFFEKSYYLTPQKILQDQLMRDFGDNGDKKRPDLFEMVDLKGRNAYPCVYWSNKLADIDNQHPDFAKLWGLNSQNLGCDQGECKRRGHAKLDECFNSNPPCPYFQRLNKAVSSKICLMNFSSFLFQTTYTERFEPRRLMVLDECHNVEDILSKFVEIKISDRYFQFDGIRFPKLDSVSEYIDYFLEIDIVNRIQLQITLAKSIPDPQQEQEWTNLLVKYRALLESEPEEWVCDYSEVSSGASRTVIIKPIFVQRFAREMLFSMADYFLMMSATVLSKKVLCQALGLSLDEAFFLQLGCNFPVENRQVLYQPSGKMTYNEKAETLPKLAADVDRICSKHIGERGIIHAHTFEICEYLMRNCKSKSRFLYQKSSYFDGDRDAVLEEHAKITDAVILAPAMHEGLDMKDDLGRFQIICKVPYPSKGDPQVSARMELAPMYYDWRTMTKLIQSCGRIIRHSEDHGKTYVLDEDFERFMKRNIKLVPKWFAKSIIWS